MVTGFQHVNYKNIGGKRINVNAYLSIIIPEDGLFPKRGQASLPAKNIQPAAALPVTYPMLYFRALLPFPPLTA
jgi:hypothetical protein